MADCFRSKSFRPKTFLTENVFGRFFFGGKLVSTAKVFGRKVYSVENLFDRKQNRSKILSNEKNYPSVTPIRYWRFCVVLCAGLSKLTYFQSNSIYVKNPSWGNQVIGSTDEQQNAYRFNPKTLKRDETKGTYIHPKHVHKSLRRYLGLENTAVDQDFKFLATEDFDFFG